MKEAVRTVMWVACSAGDALDNCKKLSSRDRGACALVCLGCQRLQIEEGKPLNDFSAP